jgi:hypothetical protein
MREKTLMPRTLLLILLVGCDPAALDKDTGTDTTPDTDSETDTDDDTRAPVLHINEFMASNASYTFEDDKQTPDWVELYNPGSAAVSLEGFTITDDLEEPGKHTFGDVDIPAGGFLLLFADSDPELGATHLSFRLDAASEDLGLYTPNGTPIDRISYTKQATDISAARIPDGGELELSSNPTPGESNGTR